MWLCVVIAVLFFLCVFAAGGYVNVFVETRQRVRVFFKQMRTTAVSHWSRRQRSSQETTTTAAAAVHKEAGKEKISQRLKFFNRLTSPFESHHNSDSRICGRSSCETTASSGHWAFCLFSRFHRLGSISKLLVLFQKSQTPRLAPPSVWRHCHAESEAFNHIIASRTHKTEPWTLKWLKPKNRAELLLVLSLSPADALPKQIPGKVIIFCFKTCPLFPQPVSPTEELFLHAIFRFNAYKCCFVLLRVQVVAWACIISNLQPTFCTENSSAATKLARLSLIYIYAVLKALKMSLRTRKPTRTLAEGQCCRRPLGEKLS